MTRTPQVPALPGMTPLGLQKRLEISDMERAATMRRGARLAIVGGKLLTVRDVGGHYEYGWGDNRIGRETADALLTDQHKSREGTS